MTSPEVEVITVQAPSATVDRIMVAVPGIQGPPGVLRMGNVNTGQPGTQASATVQNVNGIDTVHFTIPAGQTGPVGPANVLTIGTVTTGAVGAQASAAITGTAPNQTLNLTLPRGATGPANTLAIGLVNTGPAGSDATASVTGTAPNQTLHLTIPRGSQGIQGPPGIQGPKGDKGDQGIQGIQGIKGDQGDVGPAGPPNALTIGTVTTGSAGDNAGATVTGTAPSQVLNLTLPRGATGPANSLTIGTVTTGQPGTNVAATITGAAPNQTLSLTIPQGQKGDQGLQGPKGDKGDTGSQGPPGVDGAKGDTGPANVLNIGTVVTGDADTGAAATITGTAPNQTLNLTIPRGPGKPLNQAVSPNMEGTAVYAYGHSYVAGDFHGQGEAKRYILRAANRLDFSIVNRAQGGYRMEDIVLDANGSRNSWRQWGVNTKGVVLLAGVTNNALNNGTGAQAIRSYQNALRSFLHLVSLETLVDSSEAGWTITGTGATVNTSIDGRNSHLFSSNAGTVNSWSRTFTGTEVIVSQFGLAGAAGEWDILIDGTVRATVNLSNQAQATPQAGVTRDYVPVTTRISGLTNASHTLLIRPKNNVASTGGGPLIDWIGFRSATPPAVVVMKDVYTADPVNDAAFDAYNAAMDSVVAEFPNVIVCDPRPGFDRTTMIGSDTVHLTAVGSNHIADALVATMLTIPRGPGSTDAGLPKGVVDQHHEVREILEVATFNTGYGKWADTNYENLTFYLHKNGMVTLIGVFNFTAAAGYTNFVIPVSAPYAARQGRIMLLQGQYGNTWRGFDLTSTGLYVRDTMPTAAGFMAVNSTYPGTGVNPGDR